MSSLSKQGRVCVAMTFGLIQWCASVATASPLAADNGVLTGAQPSALLSVDQNRNTVIERIVSQWGAPLEQSGAGLSRAQLRTMLQRLRADHLLAARLAGSLPGLRDVLANSLTTTATATSSRVHIQAIGDTADDLVYTPVNPCRLFDTRPAQGGLGVLNPNVRRTYGATSPVANQGGPGSCNAPTGAAVALIQIGTLTPAGNGYLQGGPQGIATFPNALILYQPGDQYGTSVAMPLNVTNGRFDVQVQFAATDLYGDLLGYFERPKNYGGTHVITGIDATDSGGSDNTATGDYSTVGGGQSNTASGSYSTVAGGLLNTASGGNSTVAGGNANIASGFDSTVAGGKLNTASGNYSFAAGNAAHADANGCFAFANWANGGYGGCQGLSNIASFQLDHGLSVSYHTRQSTGGGDRFVYIGDLSTGNNTIVAWNGAALTDGGAWTNASDAAKKSDFEQVDTRAILHRVIHLPITTWRYNNEAQAVRHMGPVAQDFHSAFNLGEDDKHITTVDSEGVALAAIQGLNNLLQQKDEEIATLRRRLETIEAKLGLN